MISKKNTKKFADYLLENGAATKLYQACYKRAVHEAKVSPGYSVDQLTEWRLIERLTRVLLDTMPNEADSVDVGAAMATILNSFSEVAEHLQGVGVRKTKAGRNIRSRRPLHCTAGKA